MRQIKFRCWDTLDKKMKRVFALDFAEWWVATNYYGGEMGVCDGERNSFENKVTDRHILMQYTGLNDKNDKEIYEGDVVLLDDDKRTYKVQYLLGGFGIVGRNSGLYRLTEFSVEIIGNIYENPELLEN